MSVGENEQVLALRAPNTMPAVFVEHLRARLARMRAATLAYNTMLDQVPPELWTACDKATQGLSLDRRLFALDDMAEMLISARAGLPVLTRASKAKNQRHIADKARALKAACSKDKYTKTAELKDLLALSAVSNRTSAAYPAEVVRTLLKLGTGNTGVTLPDLLQGIADVLDESAEQLQAIDQGDEEDLWAGMNKQRQFEGSLGNAVGRAFPHAPPTAEPGLFSVADDGSLIEHEEPHGPQTVFGVSSRSAHIHSYGMHYTVPLYAPLEPGHDADFPRSAPRSQENHSYVAIGLMRWFRNYAGDDHEQLTRATVVALLGERESGRDFIAGAKSRLDREEKIQE